jgi:hypothetical protein
MGLTKQQTDELPQLDKVACTNNVAVVLLMRAAAAAAAKGDGAAVNGAAAAAGVKVPFTPTWEYGHHKWFPTLTLKSAAATAGK